MSESSHSAGNKPASEERLELEFPIAPDFDSHPPKMTMTEYHRWCVRMAAGIKNDPAARLAEKCTVEFVLVD